MKRFFSIFNFKKNDRLPELKTFKISSYDEYQTYLHNNLENLKKREKFERSLIPDNKNNFFINGFCFVCKREVRFLVDFKYCYQIDNKKIPNWRERLVCPRCKLNNRLRATIHIFHLICKPEIDSKIYITEQTTPLYKFLNKKFKNLVGSEFLGDSIPYGSENINGIRNESLTSLTFNDEEFHFILSFDVLEHIPDYKKALKECLRCLKKGGVFLFTVPFIINSRKNLIRAKISDSGEIIFLKEPEYHGDPVNPDGCLCYYHFGWELLNEIREIGFSKVYSLLYWSDYYGYLGGDQVIFYAQK